MPYVTSYRKFIIKIEIIPIKIPRVFLSLSFSLKKTAPTRAEAIIPEPQVTGKRIAE